MNFGEWVWWNKKNYISSSNFEFGQITKGVVYMSLKNADNDIIIANDDKNKKKLYSKVRKSEFGLYLFRDNYADRKKEYEINYIGNRILPIINNYSKHIKTFKKLSFTAAIASSLIPITTLIVNMSKDSEWLIVTLLVIALLGSAGTAINTYLSTHNYKNDGVIKDAQAMLLSSEIHKYYTCVFECNLKDKEAYMDFNSLVSKCESIILTGSFKPELLNINKRDSLLTLENIENENDV